MNKHKFDLRLAGRDDAEVLAKPIRSCGLFSDDEANGFIDKLPGLLSDPDQVWLRLDDPRGIAGAAYLSRDGLSQDVWNLWFIGLAPEQQAKGGGRALLMAAEASAKGADGRILLIETSSAEGFDRARRFYDRASYEVQGRIRDYYQRGEDKLIFAKHL